MCIDLSFDVLNMHLHVWKINEIGLKRSGKPLHEKLGPSSVLQNASVCVTLAQLPGKEKVT